MRSGRTQIWTAETRTQIWTVRNNNTNMDRQNIDKDRQNEVRTDRTYKLTVRSQTPSVKTRTRTVRTKARCQNKERFIGKSRFGMEAEGLVFEVDPKNGITSARTTSKKFRSQRGKVNNKSGKIRFILYRFGPMKIVTKKILYVEMF